MIRQLEEHHDALLALVAEHEVLCAAAGPDRSAISAVRFRLAQTGRARLQFLTGEVLPQATAACSPSERVRIAAFQDSLPTYQRWINQHVNRWPTTAIATSWTSYQRSAAQFRMRVRARIEEEKALFRPLLVAA